MRLMGGLSGRFDDLLTGRAWIFGASDRVVVARSLDDVPRLLRAVDEATRARAWAWGYVSYEAAPAFDPAFRVRPPDPEGPALACFAIGRPPVVLPAGAGLPDTADLVPDLDPNSGVDDVDGWRLDWGREEHRARVEAVRAAIRDGDVYQANVSTRTRAHLAGQDPLSLYAQLVAAQRGGYHAYLDLAFGGGPGRDGGQAGRHVVVSASPELFFSWDEAGLTTRPMKGTAPRGTTTSEDEAVRAELSASGKQRAENVMIVDLLRNDLARLARPGTVRTRSLLDAERYETVWQLTSTVTAQPRPEVDLLDVFTALFPCGSVTGAPKVAATGLIADLESSPRGVYCGAVGMLAPPGSEFRARFAVPIRTAVLDRETQVAVYGTGGGITWDSDPREEYDELLAKAAVLDHRARDVQLLETLRFDPATALRNLHRHLARLRDSAACFGYPMDPAAIRERLAAAAAGWPAESPRRVRLLLARTGRLTIQQQPLTDDDNAGPVTLTLDTVATAPGRWTRHKTTWRGHYQAAAARHPAADDVILVDASGHVLETTEPTSSSGSRAGGAPHRCRADAFPGSNDTRLIDEGLVHERDISIDELPGRDLAVVSSLRGWRPARLLVPPRAGGEPRSVPPLTAQ